MRYKNRIKRLTLSLLQAFKAMDDIMSPSAENDKELYRSVLFLTGVIAIFHRHSIRGWRCQVTCPLFYIARIKPFQSQSKNNIDLNGEMKLHPVGDWVVQTILLSLSCSVNKDSPKAVSFEEQNTESLSNPHQLIKRGLADDVKKVKLSTRRNQNLRW